MESSGVICPACRTRTGIHIGDDFYQCSICTAEYIFEVEE